jgi:hypothetical protein
MGWIVEFRSLYRVSATKLFLSVSVVVCVSVCVCFCCSQPSFFANKEFGRRDLQGWRMVLQYSELMMKFQLMATFCWSCFCVLQLIQSYQIGENEREREKKRQNQNTTTAPKKVKTPKKTNNETPKATITVHWK